MTDCSSIHGSTTSSSDIISSRGVPTNPRIRIIRMNRPNSRRVLLGPDSNSSFGFAIRGGKEFGTGFFVSKVEKGSEADIKGLRVGDQIIRANGYIVDDAIHKELTQFISSQDRLTLKVRGVGMLPVKEKTIDPLSWHIVPHHTLTSVTSLEEMRVPQKDVRIILKVAPRTKLGLGICKGPEWKPGIFVQFTKEFSVARDAGLRPGDQILSCNSIDFSDVLFSEAVAVMKSSQLLEMVVRTGAGLDLFPGESSGYNSSASSVTGDQSPCWGDHSSKRLSIVREESTLDKLGIQSKYWYDRNSLYRQKGQSTISSESSYAHESDGNKTIIQLSENGTLINNTLVSNINNETPKHYQSELTMKNQTDRSCNDLSSSSSSTMSSSLSTEENVKKNFIIPENMLPNGVVSNNANNDKADCSKVNGKIADICFVSRQSETKTVIVEVHRSAAAEEANRSQSSSSLGTSAPVPPPKPPPTSSSSSFSSTRSLTSSCATSSLSSAITEELKKRQERRVSSEGTIHNKNVEINGKQSEVQLRQQPMKKFGNPSLGGNDDGKRHSALMDEFKRAHRKMFKNGFQEDDTQERQAELNKNNSKKDETDHSQNGTAKTENNPQFPTPPPPPQFANCIEPQKLQSHLMSQLKLESPISTPTPDYDSTPTHTLRRNTHSQNKNGIANGTQNSTIGRVAANEVAKANGDVAEMESIESYKLQNPSSTIPRPPPVYFAPQNSGPPTMKKTKRNVALTIGEYGGQNCRKEPAKLDFISKVNENNGKDHNNSQSEMSNVSEKLRYELEKTLSRSNLKKRDSNLHNQYNNTNSMSNAKISTMKSPSPNIEKLANMLQNRNRQNENEILNQNGTVNKVTISIPNKHGQLRLTESAPPSTPVNGILKSCYTKSNNFAEKSITFGN